MTQIHPTAVVDPAARLHESVVVGPYTIVGPHVEIGAGTTIGYGLSVYVERTLANSSDNEPDSTWITVFYDF